MDIDKQQELNELSKFISEFSSRLHNYIGSKGIWKMFPMALGTEELAYQKIKEEFKDKEVAELQEGINWDIFCKVINLVNKTLIHNINVKHLPISVFKTMSEEEKFDIFKSSFDEVKKEEFLSLYLSKYIAQEKYRHLYPLKEQELMNIKNHIKEYRGQEPVMIKKLNKKNKGNVTEKVNKKIQAEIEKIQNTEKFGIVNNEEKELVVIWTLEEQNWFKNYLCKIALDDRLTSFGDEFETQELLKKLVDHSILSSNILQLTLKIAIKKLKEKIIDVFGNGSDIKENDEEKTKFLTSFAMAIQDTKKKQTYFPQPQKTFENPIDDNLTYFSTKPKNGDEKYDRQLNYITKAKTALLTFATLLTRVGKCETNIDNAMTTRLPKYFATKDGKLSILDKDKIKLPLQTIIGIDTNNYLQIGREFDMNELCGINGTDYYKNLYSKLFSLALAQQRIDGKKIEFTIPLGCAWGDRLNNYIFDALNQLLANQDSEFYGKSIQIRIQGTKDEIEKEDKYHWYWDINGKR